MAVNYAILTYPRDNSRATLVIYRPFDPREEMEFLSDAGMSAHEKALKYVDELRSQQ